MNIAIIGSSPVSLIYSLLISKLNVKSHIFCGNEIGGAWKLDKDKTLQDRSLSTHILMYSKGLDNTLKEIEYNSSSWDIDPFLLDKNFDHIGKFGSNNNGNYLGAPIKENCLTTFLVNQVHKDKNIKFTTNKKVKSINIKNEKIESLSFHSFSGVLLPTGSMLNLVIDKEQIDFINQEYEVKTLIIYIRSEDNLKSTFIHLEGMNTIIREIEIIPLSLKKGKILCKLSNKGKSSNISEIIETIKIIIDKSISIKCEIINYIFNYYQNNRRIFNIKKSLYEKSSLIIPGINFKDNYNFEKISKNSQDLSKVFYDHDKIIDQIHNKFISKSSKVFLEL